MIEIAIARSKNLYTAPFVYFAIFFQAMGITTGVYLLFGDPVYFYALAVSIICVIAIFPLLYLHRASYIALGLVAPRPAVVGDTDDGADDIDDKQQKDDEQEADQEEKEDEPEDKTDVEQGIEDKTEVKPDEENVAVKNE